jgi:hypothetical protein
MTAFKMSRLACAAAVSLLATAFAMPANAQGAWVREGDEIVYRVPFHSLRASAEVRAEAVAALRNGDSVRVGDEVVSRQVALAMGALAPAAGGLSRAAVLAEAAASRARGDWIRMGDEWVHRADSRAHGLAPRGSVEVRMLSRAGN